jgi:hypothetical protein
MDTSAARRRTPWGSVLALAFLAITLSLAFRLGPGAERPAPWPGVVAAVFAAGAAYLAGQQLLGAAWGIILALLLTLQPPLATWVHADARPVLAEALQWTALALMVAGWRLCFRERLAGLAWLVLFLVLCLDEATAWLTQPRAGLVVSLAGGAGLVAASLVALAHRLPPVGLRVPSAWNAALGLVAGLLAPVAGLAAAVGLAVSAAWLGANGLTVLADAGGPATGAEALDLLKTAVGGGTAGFALPGFTAAELGVWCWPSPWVTLPLAGWGLWRALRRGRKLAAAGRPPVSWAILVYPAAAVLGMALDPDGVRAVSFLPLASLAPLLVVFCVADLFRGLGERIVLRPPDEGVPAR